MISAPDVVGMWFTSRQQLKLRAESEWASDMDAFISTTGKREVDTNWFCLFNDARWTVESVQSLLCQPTFNYQAAREANSKIRL